MTASSHNLLNEALADLSRLTFIATPDDAKAIIEISEDYRKNTESIIQRLTSDSGTIKNQIETLSSTLQDIETSLETIKSDIETEKTNVGNISSGYETRFVEEQNTRKSEHDTTITERTENFNTFKQEHKEKIDNAIEKGNKDIETAIKQIGTKTKSSIENLENKKKEAAKIVEIISTSGITGRFHKQANSDRNWANGLKILATTCMIILAGSALYIVFNAISAGFDWQTTILRLIATFTLSIPAFYLAREAEKHRKSEQKYRKMELELASIDPYIESLPKERRDHLKESLATKIFAQKENDTDKQDSTSDISIINLLEQIYKELIQRNQG